MGKHIPKYANMGKPPLELALDDILAAIKGTGGIVSTIAKRLACDWNTADKYIKKYPETLQAYQNEKELILDMCEGTLYGAVRQGDVQSAKWILATAGKKRGFTEKMEVEHSGEVEIIPAPRPKQEK